MKISLLKIVFALVFCLLPFFASAATTDNLSGYAWSSNIGWISFNCTNNSYCATSDYGVNENPDGTLTGYAWSPSIGWIQFGNPAGGTNLSGFPSGGSAQQNAKVVGNSLTGWAKALSADGNGWDGWISLSGSSPNYGVSFDSITGAFSDFAWGADVVGWMSWNGVINGSATPVCANGANNPPFCNACTDPLIWDPVTLSCVSGTSCPSGTIGTVPPNCTCISGTYNPVTNLCDSGGNPNDGQCGSADGGTFSSLSSSSPYLCAQGAVSGFTGSGSWSWTCLKLAGGTADASCHADKTGVSTCSNGTNNPPLCNICTDPLLVYDPVQDSCVSNTPIGAVCPTTIKGSNRHCGDLPGGVGTWAGDYHSYPSMVTWTCLGSQYTTPHGASKVCTEHKGPGFVEN